MLAASISQEYFTLLCGTLGVNKEIAVNKLNKLSTDFHMLLSESQSKFNYCGLIPTCLHCCHTETLRKFNVYDHTYFHKYNCT